MDRLVLTPVEIISAIRPMVVVFGALFFLNAIGWGTMVSSTSMRCWAPYSQERSSHLFFCRGSPAGRSLSRVSFWGCCGP